MIKMLIALLWAIIAIDFCGVVLTAKEFTYGHSRFVVIGIGLLCYAVQKVFIHIKGRNTVIYPVPIIRAVESTKYQLNSCYKNAGGGVNEK